MPCLLFQIDRRSRKHHLLLAPAWGSGEARHLDQLCGVVSKRFYSVACSTATRIGVFGTRETPEPLSSTANLVMKNCPSETVLVNPASSHTILPV